LTSELERIKILEGKVSQVVNYVRDLLDENQKLKQQIKDLRADKKGFEEKAKRVSKLDENIKIYEEERTALKERIEKVIDQIDQIGI
jgi:chromosome segregation ATPase